MTRSPALTLTLILAACGSEPVEPQVVPDPVALSEAPVLDADRRDAESIDDGLLEAVVLEPVAAVPALAGSELPEPSAPILAGLPGAEITLRHGESLVLIADWTGVTSEELAELNGIDVTDFLVAGQELSVPLHVVSLDQLQESRDAALDRRLERYLRGRGGLAGVDTHRVRTGETAWSIARDRHGLPTWVLAAYNPDVDLDRLRIGDSLQVPVLADTVAEAAAVD